MGKYFSVDGFLQIDGKICALLVDNNIDKFEEHNLNIMGVTSQKHVRILIENVSFPMLTESNYRRQIG